MKINVGIIGMGRSGWELHAEPISKMENYKLVAVCDNSAKRLEEAKEHFNTEVTTDPEVIFSNPLINLVVISVPGNFHHPFSLKAMEKGKNVVVEKPMAIGLSEADEMISASKKYNVILTTFHNRRWDNDFQKLKAIADKGILGEILAIESRVMTFGTEWTTYGVKEFRPSWRLEKNFGGGFLFDWGPHLVDQILNLTGKAPVSIYCQLRNYIWAKEVDDYFSIKLVFPDNVIATLESTNDSRIPLPRWFVIGKKGTLAANGEWGKWEEMTIKGEGAGPEGEVKPLDISKEVGEKAYDVGQNLSFKFYQGLHKALSENKKPPVTSLEARNVISVLEAAKISAKENRVLYFKKNQSGELNYEQ